ncbi:MAG: class I SAM-dependent methyltransferase [Planctomycetes bacterium]|nr:class I SAM-dependent methyltransferase [Planctomycetota bacterium]
MNNYQQLRNSYRSSGMAQTYDAKRFQTKRGQILNRSYLTALTGVLNVIRQSGSVVESLLDIPCGTGRIFETLLSKGVRPVGADISLEMMKASREKVSDNHIPLVQCDATAIPFKDGSFDVVTCLRFLTMYVPPEVRHLIFKEMGRVSRGWVIIECRHNSRWSDIWYWIATRIFGKPPVINYFSRDEIKQELQQAGIELFRIFEPYGLFSNKWLILGKIIR